jgi:acetate kinase
LPEVEKMLTLPYSAWERGLRRYGFHGLSYEYLSVVLAERYGDLARGAASSRTSAAAQAFAACRTSGASAPRWASRRWRIDDGHRCGSLDRVR